MDGLQTVWVTAGEHDCAGREAEVAQARQHGDGGDEQEILASPHGSEGAGEQNDVQ